MFLSEEYNVSKGQVLGSSELRDLVSGLRANGLLSYTHLLTGYNIRHNINFIRLIQCVVSLRDRNS